MKNEMVSLKNWLLHYKIPLIHLLIWAVFFLLPDIFLLSDFTESGQEHDHRDIFYHLNLINKGFKVGFFYLNTQFLIPRFLYKKQYLLFGSSQVLAFVFILFVDYLLFFVLDIHRPFHLGRAAYHNISLFVLTSLTSIAFRAVWDKIKADYAANERQKENLKAELAFLRSQISPHFIFNVLNNIVAMVRLKSDDLEDTVVKLSTLLQYMLYETDEEKVQLQSEVEYLESYIDLQSQRFGSKIRIMKQLEVSEGGYFIEPMLLIPFVENAFKHGYGLGENPTIEIKLETHYQQLFFWVKNKFNAQNHQKDKVSGIGLANVKRRLELLYPDRHQLDIQQKDGWFLIKLTLHLKDTPIGGKGAL
jgi:two-component system, LytTR family, sensor kinase